MNINETGIHAGKAGELLNFMICGRNEDGSLTVSSAYSPTKDEIVKMIQEHGLPLDYTMSIIEDRDPMAYAVLLDVEQFEKHLRERGFR